MFRPIASLTAAVLAFSGLAHASDKPDKVTVGYLNLVNAQLVTKHLGLIAKEMPGVRNQIRQGRRRRRHASRDRRQ